jgi:hypothetical protein
MQRAAVLVHPSRRLCVQEVVGALESRRSASAVSCYSFASSTCRWTHTCTIFVCTLQLLKCTIKLHPVSTCTNLHSFQLQTLAYCFVAYRTCCCPRPANSCANSFSQQLGRTSTRKPLNNTLNPRAAKLSLRVFASQGPNTSEQAEQQQRSKRG